MSITFARVIAYLSLRAVNRNARSELRNRKSAQGDFSARLPHIRATLSAHTRYKSLLPFDRNHEPENVSVNVLS